MWLTEHDLLTVFDDVANDDADGERDSDLLVTLAALYPDTFTVADIVRAIRNKDNATSEEEFDDEATPDSGNADKQSTDRRHLLEELERLLEVPQWNDDLSVHIGTQFRKMRGRFIGGLRLIKATTHKPTKWLIDQQKP